MPKKKGFTLIELLVVIAIIVLLLAILMPSLQKAKRIAQGILCASNVKQLSLGWFAYNGDNNGNLMGAHTNPIELSNNKFIPPWAKGMNENMLIPSHADYGTIDEQIENDKGFIDSSGNTFGIKNGALWPYVENVKVYHCPGDRVIQLKQGSASPYRSFAIPRSMNGERETIGGVKTLAPYQASKDTHIKTPSKRFIFLSEFDVWIEGGALNVGAWVMDCSDPGNFWDPIAVWHNKGGTLGFADGHSEPHKWKDPETIKMAENFKVGSVPNPNTNVDLKYMREAYRATGRYK